MKYLNKLASVFFIAMLGMLTMTSCEGGDLYDIGSPEWLSEMGGGEEDESNIITVVPNPTTLGNTDNTTPWWTVFTDDIKAEPGKTYQVQFLNYGSGTSNWLNYLLVLRNEAKDFEYAVLRADNWGWGTGYTGEESDAHFIKKMESENRDWGAWAKAMSLAKCTLTLYNYGDGTADVKVIMLGSDNQTYTQEYNNISVDKDNLYFSFTCEGSHLEFGNIDIEDSEPTAMTLNGVPSEVVLGTELNEFLANVTATVTFAEGVTKEIPASELQFEIIPDFTELGQKTLVVVYNKTYMGNNCSKPVIASKTFSLVKELSAFTQTYVVPTPILLGAEDNSTPFWGAHTENIKIAPKETKVATFTNYSSCASNWNNFCIVLCKENNAEYAVVRADNYGWGDGYAACTPTMEVGRDWDVWRPAMDGAKVTTYVTNNGDGTADVKAVMVGNNGATYTQEYKGINTVDPENFYFRFTVDGCHLVFDKEVGASDCSTPFWGAHSPNIQVIGHQVCTVNFTNYSSCASNWNNFCIVLCKADNTEYAVVRADNYGWGDGYGACTATMEEGRNWDAWRPAMNGAKVSAQIVNNGDGTADIKVVMHGTDGNDYTQDYIGINTVDPDNFYFNFTVDGSYLVFE
ncbi:MAG: hypothetical protein Q4E58_11200 [Prevotellaceae bacterium]|nr:hypothetical protein [Prevotellaceae bacterium]